MRMNQVTVSVTDVARAIVFYRQLGLTQIVDAPHYARFVCPDGEASFSIHGVEAFQPSGTWVYFECDALDEKVAALQSAGMAFESDPTDQPWLWREAHLLDPDGNRIILYHAGENRLNPPWRLTDTSHP